ncbi:prephenate dehydratase [Corynebacterium sp. ES2775-CONJ]|nr:MULTISPECIES: prephenate dehydratase [unclassified Corynebacterium]MCS4490119.1 prephenate dehydratase [Corynebacterium sp. ES2775-CONJ]MCS4492072.1 prephenate dehydratase [Corynebacterium sp. ES2715-CONJ3]MCS4532180.1 prephenate dehydratase [Corynebacterium sp. ES2730-CONJ]
MNQPVTMSYLGPAGTFTEMALAEFRRAHFSGVQSNSLPTDSPSEAISAVLDRQADYACVALENSVDGPITATFDALTRGVQIYYEYDLEISFALMTRPHHSYGKRPILSTHPVAYQQTKVWIKDHIGEHEFLPASSNAAAAQAVARGEADIAVAPALSAEIYELEIKATHVADQAHAMTRFVLVGLPGVPTPRTGHDRTGLAFTLPNTPGSLVGALNECAVRGVDLTRIESRPLHQGLGSYRFYVDLHGHISDPDIQEALAALYRRATDLIFLGSWPRIDAPIDRVDQEPRYRSAQSWIQSLLKGTPVG